MWYVPLAFSITFLHSVLRGFAASSAFPKWPPVGTRNRKKCSSVVFCWDWLQEPLHPQSPLRINWSSTFHNGILE
uniref:Secreted protein n=1 Tax=Anguilla anguilla TaxID=7936 RepID=A0A0E9T662_ANGAN